MSRRKQQRKAPVESTTVSRWRRPPAAAAAGALFAAALALYWGSLGHPLVFDDRGIQEGLLRLYDEARYSLNLRWLSTATFGWVRDLTGGDWRSQRMLNVLLHAATGVALYFFLARLFELTLPKEPAAGRQQPLGPEWIAFFGALVFVLHPIAVYGTAYLVQRSIVLATLFSLVCLRLFLEGLIRGAAGWYLAAAAAYLLAVFSKEHSLALPAVAAVLAVVVRAPSARLLRELALPYALFAVIAGIVVALAKGFAFALYEPATQGFLEQSGGGPRDAAGTFPLSVINQGYLFFRYVFSWLVPYTGWMSVDVRLPFPAEITSMPQLAGFAAWLALPVGATLLLKRGGATALAGLALLYPWLLALTEMAIIRVQEPFALYRSYLWMSGLPILLAPALRKVPARWAAATLAAVCVGLVPLALNRLDTFSSQVKLWDDVVRKNEGVKAILVERGYDNRGLALMLSHQYPDALRDVNRALEINGRDVSALVGRGTLHARTGGFEAALADLGRAIEIDPTYADAWGKRCFTKMLIDRPRDALADCEKAVALAPRSRDSHTNLGVVYAGLNRIGDAEASYRRALDLDRSNADANYNFGVLLVATRRFTEARPYLAHACERRVSDACKLLERLR